MKLPAAVCLRTWRIVPESCCRILAAGLLVLAGSLSASAQEVPRPSLTRQKTQQALPTVGNLRVGPVILRVDANLTTEFVDNVNLGAVSQSDLIVTPSVGVTAIWPMTRQNTLRFRASVGYQYYTQNSDLNRPNFLVSPDSALSFDVYVGDFRLNFHEQFSIQQDTSGQGTAGVAILSRFTNTIGASVLWDLNEMIWTIGYDHFDFITIGSAANSQGDLALNTNQLDHTTDQVAASGAFKLSSIAIGGLEAALSTSSYPDSPSADFTSFTIGPFLEYQLTHYTHLYLSGGYKWYDGSPGAVGSTTAAPQTGSTPGYYGIVSIVHTLNRYYRDRLDFGHSDEVDAFNGRAKSNFVRYSATWDLNQKLSLGFGASYARVNQVSGNLFNGSNPEIYSLIGASFNTGYQLTEHVNLGLTYRYTNKDSNLIGLSYSQNSLILSLGYRF
jgi:hypothetical protein